MIIVSSVSDGRELDRVTLHDGALSYLTGRARPMFEAKRRLGLDDAAIYDTLRSWSNGYVVTREATED